MLALSLILAATPVVDCFSTKGCTTACQEGNSFACYRLGTLKIHGMEAKRDVAGGRELHGQACAQGVWQACAERNAASGPNKAPDAQLRAEACEADFFDACPARQRQRAEFEQRCQDGRARACEELARHLKNTTKDQPAGVLALNQKACDLGALRACSEVAKAYTAGRGVQANEDRAQAILEKACDQGLASACLQVASTLLSVHRKKDQTKGQALMNKACELEHETACQQSFRVEGPGVLGGAAPGGARGTAPGPAAGCSNCPR